jgi:hypothetical protein
MPRVLRGLPIGDPGEPHFDGLAGHLRMEFPDGGGPFVVDGDVRRAASVDVNAGPRVRLLRLRKPGATASR